MDEAGLDPLLPEETQEGRAQIVLSHTGDERDLTAQPAQGRRLVRPFAPEAAGDAAREDGLPPLRQGGHPDAEVHDRAPHYDIEGRGRYAAAHLGSGSGALAGSL